MRDNERGVEEMFRYAGDGCRGDVRQGERVEGNESKADVEGRLKKTGVAAGLAWAVRCLRQNFGGERQFAMGEAKRGERD